MPGIEIESIVINVIVTNPNYDLPLFFSPLEMAPSIGFDHYLTFIIWFTRIIIKLFNF
jgi:hypothetical protein